MKIQSAKLNTGERYCCSFKAAKEIFNDTDIKLSFGMYHRNFGTFARTPDAYYVQRNVKGRVLISFYMHENEPDPLISFYVIPQKVVFSNELILEVEKKHLHEFKRLYDDMKNVDQSMGKCKVMLLELIDGKLRIHEFKL